MFIAFTVMAFLFFVAGVLLVTSDPLNMESRSWQLAGWSWVAALICLGGCLANLL